MFRSLVFLLFSFSTCYCDENKSVESVHVAEVTKGYRAVLYCPAKRFPSWAKPGETAGVIGGRKWDNCDGRIVSGGGHCDWSYMVVPEVNEQQAGLYNCSDRFKNFKEFKLNVIVVDPIKVKPTTKLECPPLPECATENVDISWRKDGKAFSSESVLILEADALEGEAYVCVTNCNKHIAYRAFEITNQALA